MAKDLLADLLREQKKQTKLLQEMVRFSKRNEHTEGNSVVLEMIEELNAMKDDESIIGLNLYIQGAQKETYDSIHSGSFSDEKFV